MHTHLVRLERGARQVGHQVDVDLWRGAGRRRRWARRRRRDAAGERSAARLEARVLEPAERGGRVHGGAAAVDLLEHGGVGVLQAELQPRAAVAAEPAELVGVDGVGARL
jgi:hypothetical protein